MGKKHISSLQAWWNDIHNRLQDYPDWIVESGVSLVVGVLIGFVCRNFGRMILFFCISAVITLFILEQSRLITIQAAGLRALFTDPENTVVVWINGIASFARERLFVTVALIIGFLLGWRLGK